MSSHQNHITVVREFMQAFGQETPEELKLGIPLSPPQEVRRLRAKLILEEAFEAVKALGFAAILIDDEYEVEFDQLSLEPLYDYNFIEVLDALCDLDYVGPSGTAVALGINEELYERAFKLVHESNMRKLWTYKEFKETSQEFKDSHYSKLYAEIGGLSMMTLVKDKSGKIIKSPSWVKPNLEGLQDA